MEQERRKSDIDIALIQQDIHYIKEFIEQDRERFDRHIESTDNHATKADLEGHIVQDRWMFSTVIGLLLFILGKLFIK